MMSLKVAIPLFIAMVVSLPVSNLFLHQTPSISQAALTGKQQSFKKVAPIFARKCFDCHAAKAQLPFYAEIPIARQIIEDDIAAGLGAFSIEQELFAEGEPPSEMILTLLAYNVKNDLMPPLRYVAMHWNAALSDDEKKLITSWINDEQQSREIINTLSEEIK